MDNLPIGADIDMSAPYNINEIVLDLAIDVRSTVWYEYYNSFDIDDAVSDIKSRILAALNTLGDIRVDRLDISVY